MRCHLLLLFEESPGLLLGEGALEKVLEGEEVHLSMDLEKEVSHKQPPVFLDFEDKSLILALRGLLPDGDALFIADNCFVSFNNSFFSKGVSS